MRPNRLKARLAAGQPVFGILCSYTDPDILEFFGLLGFDFAFIDAEHGVISFETAKNLVRACNAVDITPVVRVPKNEPSIILPFLDGGAQGIIIPHCIGPTDVEAAVAACRYPPAGRRGGFSWSRVANYGLTQGAAEYYEWADREIMVCPQIEDAPALEQLDAMMQVPGADMFVVGPGDLGLSMGLRGQWFHPAVQAGIDATIAAGQRNGRWVSTLALSGEDGQELFDRGCAAIFVSAAGLIRGGTQAFLTRFKHSA